MICSKLEKEEEESSLVGNLPALNEVFEVSLQAMLAWGSSLSWEWVAARCMSANR